MTTVLDELSRRGLRAVDTDYSAPTEVLLRRVRNRTTNPYGKTEAQRGDIARHVQAVEPLLRRGATIELDGRRPVSDLADAVERLVSTP